MFVLLFTCLPAAVGDRHALQLLLIGCRGNAKVSASTAAGGGADPVACPSLPASFLRLASLASHMLVQAGLKAYTSRQPAHSPLAAPPLPQGTARRAGR